MKVMVWLMACAVASSMALAQGTAGDLKPAKFPEKKWFDRGKGFAEALELQKQNGADIVVYFAQYQPSDRRGLSHWFEQRALQEGPLSDGLKPYLKVKVELPLDKKEQDLFTKFDVSKGPVLFVVQTNGWRYRVSPFNYPDGKPELKEAGAVMEEILSKSGPRYRPAEAANPPAP